MSRRLRGGTEEEENDDEGDRDGERERPSPDPPGRSRARLLSRRRPSGNLVSLIPRR